jgi:Fe-S oxidoreductase
MVGEKIYSYFVGLKKVFDPDGILNPGKITGTPPMDTSLRYSESYRETPFQPAFNYRSEGGFLQAVERCNGSGDCRRPYWYQGTMCPSYQATLDERLSTRGRANLIREVVSNPDIQSPCSNRELLEVLDHCLSCKGCKSECPSSVDMARYKAEVLHQHYLHHPTPLGVSMVVNINNINRWFVRIPWLYNAAIGLRPVSALLKRVAGIHPKRSLPHLSVPTLETWIRRNRVRLQLPTAPAKGRVVFFGDEFTSFFDAQIGIKAITLLLKLGYEVIPYTGNESGRAAFSKGKLNHAKRCAERNIVNLRSMVKADTPLVGIEPSALLAFRDEYPDIVGDHLIEDAKRIACHTFLIEDFIVMEAEKGNITPDQFTRKVQTIVFHGHCHQKSLSRTGSIQKMLELPSGFSATEIMTGCCGMAGAFGMEKRHYDLSMQIGEQILFPYIRRLLNGTLLAMAGTSCRQQVKDGTGHTAVHPIEVICEALEDQPQA